MSSSARERRTEVPEAAGLHPERVMDATDDILTERSMARAPARLGAVRAALGRFSIGLGFAAVVTWQAATREPPTAVAVHLGALALVWVGVRLSAGARP